MFHMHRAAAEWIPHMPSGFLAEATEQSEPGIETQSITAGVKRLHEIRCCIGEVSTPAPNEQSPNIAEADNMMKSASGSAAAPVPFRDTGSTQWRWTTIIARCAQMRCRRPPRRQTQSPCSGIQRRSQRGSQPDCQPQSGVAGCSLRQGALSRPVHQCHHLLTIRHATSDNGSEVGS